MDAIMEPLKPVFITLAVLAVAGLIFLALRLDKIEVPVQKEQFLNWKRI